MDTVSHHPTPPPPVPPPGAPSRDAAGQPWLPTPAPSDPPPTPPPGAHGPAADVPGTATPRSAPPVPAPAMDDRIRSLDPRIVQVWRVFGALGWLLPFGPLSVVAALLVGGWVGAAIPVTVLVLVALHTALYQRARFRRWRWQLADLALELRYGVLVHRHEAVPYFRIQQIDVAQGPLDRLLGLATLQVTTASASGSVALPGIAADDAPTVRAELLARATAAVADHPGEISDAV